MRLRTTANIHRGKAHQHHTFVKERYNRMVMDRRRLTVSPTGPNWPRYRWSSKFETENALPVRFSAPLS